MKLSVIIAVFNGEQYLEACLASVIAQVVEDMEILLINDGSTDGTSAICNHWAGKYQNLRVYHHSTNYGLGAARNLGINSARGELITFVDADDLLHPDMYKVMLRALIVTNADIVECGIDDFGESVSRKVPEFSLFAIRSGREILLNAETRNIVVWNKIYAGKLWKNIRFPVGKIHEDEFVYFKILYAAEKVLQMGNSFYRYRHHSGSITGSQFKKHRLDVLEARTNQIRYFRVMNERKLIDASIEKWYWNLVQTHKLCRENFMYFNAFVLRFQLLFRMGWVLSNNNLKLHKRFSRVLFIPPGGRIFHFSKFVKDELKKINQLKKKQKLKNTINVRTNSEEKPQIFSLLEPEHGNIGDHAIILGQNLLLTAAFPGNNRVSITQSNFEIFIESCRDYVGRKDLIVLPGGGSLGDTYPEEEEKRRQIIQAFPNNVILCFPQSVYFSKTIKGRYELDKTVHTYSRHTKMFLCTRDPQSRDFLKENISGKDISLFPDMALMLKSAGSTDRNGVLLCLRNDIEGVLTNEEKISIMEKLIEIGLEFRLMDNHTGGSISESERNGIVHNQLELFRNSELVITDRLHGLIFSLVTGTPCMAIDNKSHKIMPFRHWLRASDDVQFYNGEDCDSLISGLNNYTKRTHHDSPQDFSHHFESMITDVRSLLIEGE